MKICESAVPWDGAFIFFRKWCTLRPMLCLRGAYHGRKTLEPADPPGVVSFAAVAGKLEGEGPLGGCFDAVGTDAFCGKKTWEQGEAQMQADALRLALQKGGLAAEDVDCAFAGDLLNQNIGATFALRDFNIPFYGVYGACSTMGETLSLAAMAVASGAVRMAAAQTSSHFCTAERQYRFPLEYGGQRTPTAQWTVTGSGAVILQSDGAGPYITYLTPGRIVDAGITDANNMGSAMAPAAYETLKAHFADTGRDPDYYDMIATGDLGAVGHDTLEELFRRDGVKLGKFYTDCGVLIFDRERQDVHSGGSGCGCSAAVFCSLIMRGFSEGKWSRVLFAPTGALMSPTSTQQGASIPGICHALAIEKSLPVRGEGYAN